MSEENNQEDLSVEDILSSIKNILVDENGSPIEEEQPEEESPLKNPVEEKVEDETTDVFNLDDSMIVSDTPKNTEDETDINTILNEPEEKTPEAESNNEDIADIDIQKTLDISEEMDIDSILKNVVPEETTSLPSQEDNLPKEEPVEVKEEAIDTSASIINNFAKVFAEKQQEHAQQQAAENSAAQSIQSSIEQAGITDMVKEAIVEQVKTSINTHFEQIASKIIAEQTKNWLNAHLAEIVERTVAKEIERVIEKVGS